MSSAPKTPNRDRAPDPNRTPGPTCDTPAEDAEGELVNRGGRIDIEGTPDRVQEASEESFPASDPPSYSPPAASGPPARK